MGAVTSRKNVNLALLAPAIGGRTGSLARKGLDRLIAGETLDNNKLSDHAQLEALKQADRAGGRSGAIARALILIGV